VKGDFAMKIPDNILNALTDEQKKLVEAAKSPEELLAIVKEVGLELTDEQLEGLAGGTGPLGYVDSRNKTGPLGETGPLGAVGPVGDSCDPAGNAVGPVGYPY
jgi:hypothetical protein